MKKNLTALISLIAIIGVSSPITVLAETSASGEVKTDTRVGEGPGIFRGLFGDRSDVVREKQDARTEDRAGQREEMKDRSAENRTEMKDRSAEARTQHQEEMKDRSPEDRQEMKDRSAEVRVKHQAEMRDRSAEVRMRFASSSTNVKARIKEDIKARVEQHANRIYGSLTTALDRLASFETKVDARLDELAAAGIDVSLSREKLDMARGVRISAAAHIKNLDADLAVALDGETSREEVIAIMKAAREELGDVRKAYADVLIQVRADVKVSKQSE